MFVLASLASTFWQNYRVPLDGDLAFIVFPAPWYSEVLHDPFGWSVLTKNAVYGGTNRFFAHATLSLYWKQAPHLLQTVMTPISSVYAASALFTTFTQALLVFTLAAYVRLSGTLTAIKSQWALWLAVALMLPLFQTYGFYEQMAITNRAITYTTFYAFPMALLLLLLWPFYAAAQRQQPLRLHPVRIVLLLLLMVLIAFNGPIPVAALAVVLFGIGLYWLGQRWQHWKATGQLTLRPIPGSWLSGQAILLIAVLIVLCMYSLYIGRNNSENTHTHTLGQLYELLPQGLYYWVSADWGLPLLLFVLVINSLLIRRLAPDAADRQRILLIMRWVVLFSVLYILLLPFGGYRTYRPYLIRNDSVLPVLLGCAFAYGLSAYYLVLHLRGKLQRVYLAAVVALAVTFVYVDKTKEVPTDNGCERWAMDQMANSPDFVVHISSACNLMSWNTLRNSGESEYQGKLLHYWGITQKVQQYQQD
ncbi:hypothetical protein [Hymenobacter cellulosilyticus]|uniref:Uncharacterized protein n=1 Tax=Hymenobacter cellulosilyticus TaxID=2932248 RepID=A0A8T9Q7E9_9BACT|nr:hypothetical protein [Hymenobacter cellulosilyticus]UOQ73506.1 hypothetical protein MUN79_06100 [Hymenobacter cellulosilyticus]